MAQLIFPGTANPNKVLNDSTFSAGTYFNATGTIANQTALSAGTSFHVTATNRTTGASTEGNPNVRAYLMPPAGYYDGFTWLADDQPDLIPGNILSGKFVLNTEGTIPVRSAGANPATGTAQWPDGSLAVYLEGGYYAAGAGPGEVKVTPAQLQGADGDLIAANITTGKTIFGIVGTGPAYSLVNITSNTQKGHLGTSMVTERQVTMNVNSQIKLSVDLYNSNVNGYCWGAWYKNGSMIGSSAGANSQTRVKCTAIATCAPGDVFEMRQYGESSSVWSGNEIMTVTSYIDPQVGGTINVS